MCGSPNRREFLFVGLVGSLGLTLGNVLKLQAQSASAKARAQSVINIFLPGGIAAQESFDPKLLAPIEYRGPLGTVKTKLDGRLFRRAAAEDGAGGGPALRGALHDPRRGGPCARDAQYVHGLAAQPSGAVSEHRQHRVA